SCSNRNPTLPSPLKSVRRSNSNRQFNKTTDGVVAWRISIAKETPLWLASRQRLLRNVSPKQIVDAARFFEARPSRRIALCVSDPGQCRPPAGAGHSLHLDPEHDGFAWPHFADIRLRRTR